VILPLLVFPAHFYHIELKKFEKRKLLDCQILQLFKFKRDETKNVHTQLFFEVLLKIFFSVIYPLYFLPKVISSQISRGGGIRGDKKGLGETEAPCEF
jgi:hypothetical protein